MDCHPVGARVVAWVASACLVAMFVATAVFLPDEIRATFDAFQTITLLACLGAAVGILHGIARSRVRTDEAGVHVRNGYRTHVVAWEDVEGVSFRTGAPWATLARRDGETHMLIGIQGTDGEVARKAVHDLRSEIAAHR